MKNICEIYLTVHDGNHELDLSDRVPNENEFKVVYNSSWNISSENFVKHIFVNYLFLP